MRTTLRADGTFVQSAGVVRAVGLYEFVLCASWGPTGTLRLGFAPLTLRICAGQRVVVASRPVRRTLFPGAADQVKCVLTCENTAP